MVGIAEIGWWIHLFDTGCDIWNICYRLRMIKICFKWQQVGLEGSARLHNFINFNFQLNCWLFNGRKGRHSIHWQAPIYAVECTDWSG